MSSSARSESASDPGYIKRNGPILIAAAFVNFYFTFVSIEGKADIVAICQSKACNL